MAWGTLSLHNPLIGALVIIIVVAIAVAIQLISDKWFSDDDFDRMQNVGGTYMSLIGTLYSVILGMILVDASGNFVDAKRFVEQEAKAITGIYFAAQQLPSENKIGIQSSIRDYVEFILSRELDGMHDERSFSESSPLFINIWNAVKTVEPVTENQKAIYQSVIEHTKDALDNRRSRIAFSSLNVSWIEWFCLLAGGIINIALSFFFNLRNKTAHAIMTGMVTFMISINLYAIYMLSDPYSGFMEIPKGGFTFVMDSIQSGYAK